MTVTSISRQYWVWITNPEYYLNEDGSERDALEPRRDYDAGGWWTCHKNTQKGDLILLYRTTPKRNIAYLIQAKSDAYSLTTDNYASDMGWDYGCDYLPIYKFNNPLTIRDMRDHPQIQEWSALRGSFQRRVYSIPPDQWTRITKLLDQANTGYLKALEKITKEDLVREIRLEEELEDDLVNNLGSLKKFGFDLELYHDNRAGISGRQLVCSGHGGRIDLLCIDKNSGNYVVIELKNVRAGQNTFGQIISYIGWVKDFFRQRKPVLGIVISRGFDVRFESSLRLMRNTVTHIDLSALGYS